MFPNPMFDGAMYAQMAAAAAMGDLIRAGRSHEAEEAEEVIRHKEEPEAAAFDKDMLARLAKQAAERETEVEVPKRRDPSPPAEHQVAASSPMQTSVDPTCVEQAPTFALPAAFRKKMEKKAAESQVSSEAPVSQLAQEAPVEVQAYSTEMHEEPERNIFREASPEPVLIPVHPITLKPLRDGKRFDTAESNLSISSASGGKGPGKSNVLLLGAAKQAGVLDGTGKSGNSIKSIVDNVVGALHKNVASSAASARVAPPLMKPDSAAHRSATAHLPKADLFLPNAREPIQEEQFVVVRPPAPAVDPDERKLLEAQRIAEQIEKNRKEEEGRRAASERDRHGGERDERDRGGRGSDRTRGNDRGSGGDRDRRDRGDRVGGSDRDRQFGRRSRSRSRRVRRSRTKSRSRSRPKRRSNLFSSAPTDNRITSKLSSDSITERASAVAEISGYSGAVDPRSVSLQPGEVPDWLKDLANPVPTSQPSGFYMGRKVLRMPGAYIKCLIGKGGETIRNIRTRTGADIKIEGKPDDFDGVVSIAGNIRVAENMIRETLSSKGCIWEAQEGAGPLLGSTTTNVGWKNYDEMEDLRIPTELVGLFIGNNGCGFKEIKARTGGHVTIKVLPEILGGNTQSIQVVGDNWKVARQIVREKIDHIKKTTPGPWQAGWTPIVGNVEHRNLNANKH